MTLQPNLDEFNKEFYILTNEEAILLANVRAGKFKSIKIKFSENGKINMLELIKIEPIQHSKYLKNLILINGYQNISYNITNGKIVSCTNTTKIKL